MSTLPIKRLIAAAVLTAMMALQVSGEAVRYLCDCVGEVVFTADEHCHGEHGEEGPIDHAPIGHRHDDGHHEDHEAPVENAPTEDHHHHHIALDTSESGNLPDVVTAPALRLLPIFWIELVECVSAPAARIVVLARPPREDGGPPSTSLLVTRSVVRLI